MKKFEFLVHLDHFFKFLKSMSIRSRLTLLKMFKFLQVKKVNRSCFSVLLGTGFCYILVSIILCYNSYNDSVRCHG